MCVNKPFMCTKFQRDLRMSLHFIAKFASVQNESERKTKKLKQNFGCLYLGSNATHRTGGV